MKLIKKLMKNVPKKIYLQVSGTEDALNDDFNKLEGITWSDERINKSDIEFELKGE